MPNTSNSHGLRSGGVPHQTLAHMAAKGPQSANAIRKAVMGENTQCLLAEFLRDILTRLDRDGLAEKQRNSKWSITPAGHQALLALNATPGAVAAAATKSIEAIRQSTGVDARMLTAARRWLHALNAESTPPRQRPEACDCEGLPSRRGERLVYRSGRVTDLDGNLLHTAAA